MSHQFTVRKAIQISKIKNVEENQLLHELFRVVSRIPATFHVISWKVNNLMGQCIMRSHTFKLKNLVPEFTFLL